MVRLSKKISGSCQSAASRRPSSAKATEDEKSAAVAYLQLLDFCSSCSEKFYRGAIKVL